MRTVPRAPAPVILTPLFTSVLLYVPASKVRECLADVLLASIPSWGVLNVSPVFVFMTLKLRAAPLLSSHGTVSTLPATFAPEPVRLEPVESPQKLLVALSWKLLTAESRRTACRSEKHTSEL